MSALEDSFFERLFEENLPPDLESPLETPSSLTEVTVGSLDGLSLSVLEFIYQSSSIYSSSLETV